MDLTGLGAGAVRGCRGGGWRRWRVGNCVADWPSGASCVGTAKLSVRSGGAVFWRSSSWQVMRLA